ncbi:MAG: sugar phosphate isomerase/epimerase [Burkholderiales bacterium]|nr:sugar phosphate isomerase/epimerase [Phycisphaerae bacterium]
MKFGICTGMSNAPAAKAAGWDYIEESVQGALKGQVSDAEWAAPAAGVLPTIAANSMVPAAIPIVGPNVSVAALEAYMTNVLARAPRLGIKTVVFGSGPARNVPDGFDRNRAVDQITTFLNLIAPIAQKNGVTIVIEPLNKSESNILNTVGESMTYVKRVNHPNIQCLVDSYHFWLEDEPLANLEEAMPWIKHVHVADRDGRVAPGESGTSDYASFFKVIKQGGYDLGCSVECRGFDFDKHGTKILGFLKDHWTKA